MKTDIYGLLGMIKDGKAPKKIIYDGVVFNFDTEDKDYYDEKYGNLFEYLFNNVQTDAFLNNEVEILDEPKEDKIKSISYCRIDGDETVYQLQQSVNVIYKDIVDKINEIIDRLNEKCQK